MAEALAHGGAMNEQVTCQFWALASFDCLKRGLSRVGYHRPRSRLPAAHLASSGKTSGKTKNEGRNIIVLFS